MTLFHRRPGDAHGHLHENAAAVVDGELGHDARDRALAHLAGCPDCRDDVQLQRWVKGRLARLGDPQLPGALEQRLLGLAGPADPDAGVAALPTTSAPRLAAAFVPAGPAPGSRHRSRPHRRPALARRGGNDPVRPGGADNRPGGGARPGGASGPHRRHHRAVRVTAISVVSGALACCAAALAVGGGAPSGGGPAVTPAVARFVDEHAATDTLPVPGSDIGAAVTVSFAGVGGP